MGNNVRYITYTGEEAVQQLGGNTKSIDDREVVLSPFIEPTTDFKESADFRWAVVAAATFAEGTGKKPYGRWAAEWQIRIPEVKDANGAVTKPEEWKGLGILDLGELIYKKDRFDLYGNLVTVGGTVRKKCRTDYFAGRTLEKAGFAKLVADLNTKGLKVVRDIYTHKDFPKNPSGVNQFYFGTDDIPAPKTYTAPTKE
jgi:hypothetical protein